MQTLTTRSELRSALDTLRGQGKRVALVPTMGYLHEGHLTLVDHARRHGDVVVMSIYVNPLQFGPGEDLATYPRDLARDAELAGKRGVDIIFAPGDAEMYQDGRPAVTVVANQLADRLCGHFRPGHFEGVLTVVAKLFNIVQPDAAVFGMKDYQQCMLVRRLCRDLDFPIEVVIAPTVREPDGLAMSSRNVYLSPEERHSALQLARALHATRALYQSGERDPMVLVKAARAVLALDSAVRPQYVELVDPGTLEPPARARSESVLAVAAYVGKTRLIDNLSMAE